MFGTGVISSAFLSAAAREEIADYAVRKTELLARQRFRQGEFRTQEGLIRWAIERARREALRQLPLHHQISQWLSRLPADQRRDVLLEYEFGSAADVGAFLGISEVDAQRRLDRARRALEAVIREDGQQPYPWLGLD